MMPHPAILLVYSPLNRSISDLNNFTSVPHPNHWKLIRKSLKKLASSKLHLGTPRALVHSLSWEPLGPLKTIDLLLLSSMGFTCDQHLQLVINSTTMTYD